MKELNEYENLLFEVAKRIIKKAIQNFIKNPPKCNITIPFNPQLGSLDIIFYDFHKQRFTKIIYNILSGKLKESKIYNDVFEYEKYDTYIIDISEYNFDFKSDIAEYDENIENIIIKLNNHPLVKPRYKAVFMP